MIYFLKNISQGKIFRPSVGQSSASGGEGGGEGGGGEGGGGEGGGKGGMGGGGLHSAESPAKSMFRPEGHAPAPWYDTAKVASMYPF